MAGAGRRRGGPLADDALDQPETADRANHVGGGADRRAFKPWRKASHRRQQRDHAGDHQQLPDLNPEVEIVASKVAIQFLENQVHRPFKSRAVKSGEGLDLGTNPESGVQHRFEFLSAPNLHWPDTIFSFDHGTGILYTCDAFGLHYCSDDVFDVDPGAIAPDFRFYYDCLMGPNARSVLQALKRMDALPPITTVAVGHGPLLREHLGLWLSDYRDWSTGRSKGEAYAAVCYVSQYGFCDRLSQAIARGIGKAGAQVQLVDLRATDAQELSALIGEASAVVRCRVEAASERMLRRNPAGVSNSALSARDLRQCGAIDAEALDLWQAAIDQRGLSARAAERVLRMGRTIADLGDQPSVEASAIAEALSYRSFDQLSAAGADRGRAAHPPAVAGAGAPQKDFRRHCQRSSRTSD